MHLARLVVDFWESLNKQETLPVEGRVGELLHSHHNSLRSHYTYSKLHWDPDTPNLLQPSGAGTLQRCEASLSKREFQEYLWQILLKKVATEND